MLENVFSALEEQKQTRDGAVCRPEFTADYGVEGWPLLSDPDARQKLEAFVLRAIPERHRFRMADGSQGIVYFDSRGRATTARLTEVPDAELMRMAREKGKRVDGDGALRREGGGKPQTGKTDHGYTAAVQEELLQESVAKFREAAARLMKEFVDKLDASIEAPQMPARAKAQFLRILDKEANKFLRTIEERYKGYER
jgi:hypothetical protein